MEKDNRWKSTMHVEIAYADGTREGVAGDVIMVYKAQAVGNEYRPTLAVSGALDVRALYGLLILLDMHLADDPDALDTAIDVWHENRERLLQEAVENRKEVSEDE